MNTSLNNSWHPFSQSRRPRRRWPLWGGSLLAGLILLAGCSNPARPSTAPRPAVIIPVRPAVITSAPAETSETRFLAAVSQARIFVEDRPDYAAALTHLDHLENLCVRAAAEPHCTGPAYFRWQERKQYLQTVRRTLVAQYNDHLSQAQTQWWVANRVFLHERRGVAPAPGRAPGQLSHPCNLRELLHQRVGGVCQIICASALERQLPDQALLPDPFPVGGAETPRPGRCVVAERLMSRGRHRSFAQPVDRTWSGGLFS